MAKSFTRAEWRKIRALFDAKGAAFGLPEPVYGSVLGASFNIRKLGSKTKRSSTIWAFLADVCRRFDLLAVQEVMEDLSGVRHLRSLMGPDFELIVSDTTGVFPGEPGLGERLAFIYNRRVVERTELATDVTYDRSKFIGTIAANFDALQAVAKRHIPTFKAYMQALHAHEDDPVRVKKPKKPAFKVQLPTFLTFIRAPFCVGFRIQGHPGTTPYEFLAVNAHLYFGNFMSDRRQEFDALMRWIRARVTDDDALYAPNVVLMGDLNLDFDSPNSDRKTIDALLRDFDTKGGRHYHVNFPFLDVHPSRRQVFRTNARLNETFDQIGFFCRDDRFPRFEHNELAGIRATGPDYGVFDFANLFGKAVHGQRIGSLKKAEKKTFYERFEHSVSDHMPLWVRLPLPD